jgi:hypothetical protein
MSLAKLLKKGGLAVRATAAVATDEPALLAKVAEVATVAVANGPDVAANDPEPDRVRGCSPGSVAMNGREIDTFEARLASFVGKGVAAALAENLAKTLVIRDRDNTDTRRSCLECNHLHPGMRCASWQRAGVAIRSRDSKLPTDFAILLQHCDGFNGSGVNWIPGNLSLRRFE